MPEKMNYLQIPIGDQVLEEYGPLLRGSIMEGVKAILDSCGTEAEVVPRDIKYVQTLLDLILKIDFEEMKLKNQVLEPLPEPGGK